MPSKTFLRICREGWPLVGLVAALWLYVYLHYGLFASLPLLLVMAYLAAFFHEPDRRVPSQPLAVIAPTDGKVIEVGNGRDPFLDREALRVCLRVNRLGAYFLRSPSEGTVLEIPAEARQAFPGVATWIRTDEADDIVLAVRSGSLFGANPCTARYGERVGQGRRCGLRRLAQQVEIYLPSSSRLEIGEGSVVQAGCDKLATLVRKTSSQTDPEQTETKTVPGPGADAA